MLSSYERYTREQSMAMQEGVAAIDERLISLGFEPGDTEAERNVMVGEGMNFHLEKIVGSSAAMEMYLRELRDQSRELEGVWNLPGTAYVPLMSIRGTGSVAANNLPGPQQEADAGTPSAASIPLLIKEMEEVVGGRKQPTIKELIERKPQVLQNLIILDDQVIAEKTAVIQGREAARSSMSGNDMGSTLAPNIM
jgi:hypothetical protein